MRQEIITTAEQWRGLRGEWNALLTQSNANSLFMTWQWLDTWLQVREYEHALLVICIRGSSGELLGVAPFYKAAYRLVRVLPYRVLRIVGDVESGAEYQTWIAKRACEAQVFAAIVQVLRKLRSEWDLIWMPRLPCWTGPQRVLLEALRAGGIAANRRPTPFSAVALPTSYAAYLARMTRHRRQHVRGTRNKVLSQPGVEVRKITARAELEPALRALFDLHGRRWKAAGQDGVFVRNPREKAFYERFAPQALEAGWLAFYLLVDRDEPKAAQIGYIYDGALLQLQEGFDPDYSSGAGNALRAYVIQECIDAGLREYDFLAGLTEHKQRWLAEQRMGMDLLVGATRLKNAPILQAGVWPTGAYLRPDVLSSPAAT